MKVIQVPATSANLGPGFDSCGLALSLYFTLEIGEVQDEWWIDHTLEGIPHDETNLVIQTALEVAADLQPHRLRMKSEIPTARGLGSSSTAIVAGIELANELASLHLTTADKIRLATKFEGHPDNVAPAIAGDFVVAASIEEEVYAVKHRFPPCAILAVIPDQELLTSESRDALPKRLAYGEAVTASSISNVMIAAILNHDLSLMGQLMEEDRWHENYRAHLVPHLAEIRAHVAAEEGYGAVLSGAGPTILVFCTEEQKAKIGARLLDAYPQWRHQWLHVEASGTRVLEL